MFGIQIFNLINKMNNFFVFVILSSFLFNAIKCDSNERDSSVCLNLRDKGDSSCAEPVNGLRFYYDKNTAHCQPFFYAGCNGNDNRFETLNECNEHCFNITVKADASVASGHGRVIPVPKCEGGVRAAVDSSSRLIKCEECPNGYSCSGGKCCPSKEYTCKLDYDTGKYATTGSHTPRYFYSDSAKNCLLFTYYGALGNANNFATYNDCKKFCKKN